MDSGAFYHIMIVPKPGIAPGEVESGMNLALDWLHYHENTWIVYSTSDIYKWRTRLEPIVNPGGELLICKLATITETQGWTYQYVWDWINQKRG